MTTTPNHISTTVNHLLERAVKEGQDFVLTVMGIRADGSEVSNTGGGYADWMRKTADTITAFAALYDVDTPAGQIKLNVDGYFDRKYLPATLYMLADELDASTAAAEVEAALWASA